MAEGRNPGTPFRPEAFARIAVNTPAAERRAATLTARRSLKGDWQAAWLLNAVRCIDLTTLSGDPAGQPPWVRALAEGDDAGYFRDGGAVWTVHAYPSSVAFAT